jgi:phage terminase small subunit
MGELNNPRHERFAQELAAGNSADAAYEAAGYRKHRGNAARLNRNPCRAQRSGLSPSKIVGK